MSRQAVKFPAGEARHLAAFLRATGSVNLHPVNKGDMEWWVDTLESGRPIKIEPAQAKALIGLMSRVCRPHGKQVAEYDAITKRLQGGR